MFIRAQLPTTLVLERPAYSVPKFLSYTHKGAGEKGEGGTDRTNSGNAKSIRNIRPFLINTRSPDLYRLLLRGIITTNTHEGDQSREGNNIQTEF